MNPDQNMNNSNSSTATATPEAKDYHGFVLAIEEENRHDDSDFYAYVWDTDTQSVLRIDDGTTRYAAPARYHDADAPEAIRALATEWVINNVLTHRARTALQNAAQKFHFGDEVMVVAGRKAPIGLVGEISWLGRDQYYSAPRYGNALGLRLFDARAYRVGIRDAAGKVTYTSLANVELTRVPLPSAKQVKETARSMWTGDVRSSMHWMGALAGAFASRV